MVEEAAQKKRELDRWDISPYDKLPGALMQSTGCKYWQMPE
jgi:hypothetical protein